MLVDHEFIFFGNFDGDWAYLVCTIDLTKYLKWVKEHSHGEGGTPVYSRGGNSR